MTFRGMGVAIALITGLGVVTPSQSASAQNILVDLATASLNTLFNRSANNPQTLPQPVPNSNYTFGTGNMNGNNVNFCLLPCVPNGASSARNQATPTIPSGIVPSRSIVTQQPTGLPPGVVPNRTIPMQQPTGFPPGVVPNRTISTNGLPPRVIPNQTVPTPQNRPRPTIIIPPITLPFSL
ncbi:MAG TPA: hypothetical protein ACFCUY_08385 [Xenococcaceae cyanobacterium]